MMDTLFSAVPESGPQMKYVERKLRRILVHLYGALNV